MRSAPAREVFQINRKSGGHAAQDHDRDIPLSALNPAEEGLVHFSLMGELLLRETFLPSERLHIQADSHAHIHGGMATFTLDFRP